MSQRTNQEWLDALRGPQRDAALAELRTLLVRGLRLALFGVSGVDDANLEDFTQDALVKILAGLDSFRGEARFTTWAQKIAINVAFTELRRTRWRDISLDEAAGDPNDDFIPETFADSAAGPETEAIQHSVLSALREAIDQDLTDKQREALIAVRLQGMPLVEVARRMNTNRNALYKLLHDARKRLKMRLMAKGLSAEDILSAF